MFLILKQWHPNDEKFVTESLQTYYAESKVLQASPISDIPIPLADIQFSLTELYTIRATQSDAKNYTDPSAQHPSESFSSSSTSSVASFSTSSTSTPSISSTSSQNYRGEVSCQAATNTEADEDPVRVEHGSDYYKTIYDRLCKDRKLQAQDLETMLANVCITQINEIFVKRQALLSGKIFIIGNVGVGKTTLARHIAFMWATTENAIQHALRASFKFLFLIRLSNLAKVTYADSKTPEEQLAKLVIEECFNQKNQAEISISSMRSILCKQENRSKILWVLDGYDEIVRVLKQNKKAQSLFDLMLSYPNLILSSRIYDPGDFANVCFDRRLQHIGFSSEQIEKYVADYFKRANSKNSQLSVEVNGLINSNPEIVAAAKTPLLLSILCSHLEGLLEKNSHHSDSTTEQKAIANINSAQLYREFVCMLLKYSFSKQANSKKNYYDMTSSGIEQEAENELLYLSYLAYKGMQQNSRNLDPELYDQVTNALAKLFGKKVDFIDIFKLGFLRTDDISARPNVSKFFYFVHFSFQEFLTAWFINKYLTASEHAEVREAIEKLLVTERYDQYYKTTFTFVAQLTQKDNTHFNKFWELLFRPPLDLTRIGHTALVMHYIEACRCDPHIPNLEQHLYAIRQWLMTAIYRVNDVTLFTIASQHLLPILGSSNYLIKSEIINKFFTEQLQVFGSPQLYKKFCHKYLSLIDSEELDTQEIASTSAEAKASKTDRDNSKESKEEKKLEAPMVDPRWYIGSRVLHAIIGFERNALLSISPQALAMHITAISDKTEHSEFKQEGYPLKARINEEEFFRLFSQLVEPQVALDGLNYFSGGMPLLHAFTFSILNELFCAPLLVNLLKNDFCKGTKRLTQLQILEWFAHNFVHSNRKNIRLVDENSVILHVITLGASIPELAADLIETATLIYAKYGKDLSTNRLEMSHIQEASVLYLNYKSKNKTDQDLIKILSGIIDLSKAVSELYDFRLHLLAIRALGKMAERKINLDSIVSVLLKTLDQILAGALNNIGSHPNELIISALMIALACCGYNTTDHNIINKINTVFVKILQNSELSPRSCDTKSKKFSEETGYAILGAIRKLAEKALIDPVIDVLLDIMGQAKYKENLQEVSVTLLAIGKRQPEQMLMVLLPKLSKIEGSEPEKVLILLLKDLGELINHHDDLTNCFLKQLRIAQSELKQGARPKRLEELLFIMLVLGKKIASCDIMAELTKIIQNSKDADLRIMAIEVLSTFADIVATKQVVEMLVDLESGAEQKEAKIAERKDEIANSKESKDEKNHSETKTTTSETTSSLTQPSDDRTKISLAATRALLRLRQKVADKEIAAALADMLDAYEYVIGRQHSYLHEDEFIAKFRELNVKSNSASVVKLLLSIFNSGPTIYANHKDIIKVIKILNKIASKDICAKEVTAYLIERLIHGFDFVSYIENTSSKNAIDSRERGIADALTDALVEIAGKNIETATITNFFIQCLTVNRGKIYKLEKCGVISIITAMGKIAIYRDALKISKCLFLYLSCCSQDMAVTKAIRDTLLIISLQRAITEYINNEVIHDWPHWAMVIAKLALLQGRAITIDQDQRAQNYYIQVHDHSRPLKIPAKLVKNIEIAFTQVLESFYNYESYAVLGFGSNKALRQQVYYIALQQNGAIDKLIYLNYKDEKISITLGKSDIEKLMAIFATKKGNELVAELKAIEQKQVETLQSAFAATEKSEFFNEFFNSESSKLFHVVQCLSEIARSHERSITLSCSSSSSTSSSSHDLALASPTTATAIGMFSNTYAAIVSASTSSALTTLASATSASSTSSLGSSTSSFFCPAVTSSSSSSIAALTTIRISVTNIGIDKLINTVVGPNNAGNVIVHSKDVETGPVDNSIDKTTGIRI